MRFRRRQDSDFQSEIEAHIRLEVDRLIAEGLSPAVAQATARRAFGNIGIARQRFYESHRWMWWDELRRDLRYGLRSLPVRDPSALVFVLAAGTTGTPGAPPYSVFARLRERTSAFAGMAAFATDEIRIEIDGHPEPVNGQIASGDYFSLLRSRHLWYCW